MSQTPPPQSAREEILARIRTALPGEPTSIEASHAAISRNYTRTGQLDRQACIDLFIDRLVDYDTEVIQLPDEARIAQSVEDALRSASEKNLIVPETFPPQWLPAGVSVTIDDHCTSDQIEHMQAVLTTCEAAVAATGTIFLIHGGHQGRRVITLLPDHHICLVRRNQVYELIPEALAAIAPSSMQPVTSISGPSATADIEMTRIKGVHGPRRLTVILYGTP
jgi:L-lactate dehydrogenase complex protein LldG